jgi:putative membrane protein
MENVRNRSVWVSKLRTVVIAAFAVTAGAAGRVMANPTAPAPSTADDAGIARWVVAVNQAEVQVSAAVKGKLVSVGVRQLADRIGADHADLEQKFQGLAGDGSASGSYTEIGGRADGADLSRLSGDELEKAYIDREVKFHEVVLARLNQDLIPSANNAALRDQLAVLSSELQAELQHARNVQQAEWFWRTAEEERAQISREP